MDLIDRYIYAVTKELPSKQREDISEELRGLIDDMLEAHKGDQSHEDKIRAVLMALGNPVALANNYKSRSRYLIGPKLFDSYLMVLKIVAFAVFIGISVATAVGGIYSAEENIIKIALEYIATLLSAVSQAFVWVTVSFAIAEHYDASDVNILGNKEEWSLDSLPRIPQKEARISRAETITGIIFTTIFVSIIYFYPKIFAIYSSAPSGMKIVPIFNLEVLEGFKVIIALIFLIGIAKETVKLVAGRWSLKIAIITSMLSIASLVFTLLVFTNPNIYNPYLADELKGLFNLNLSFDLANAQYYASRVLIIIIIAGSLGEIVGALYKGIKYNNIKL